MKRCTVLVVLLLVACSNIQPHERSIVGQWSWNIHDHAKHYEYDGEISFRRDGTMSRSSEACFEDGPCFAEDSFGIHHYGWFIQDTRLCFAEDKRSWKKRSAPNPDQQCSWKVRRELSGNVIVLMWDDTLDELVELKRVQ